MLPPTFTTKNLTVKPYEQEDEDAFVEMGMDDQSVRFMGGAQGNEQEERDLFRKIFTIYKSNEARWFWIWGIYKDQTLYGHLELKESVNTSEGELAIIYMVHPSHRKKGVMTEVLAYLKSIQHQWNKRLIVTINPENKYSLALAERWGIDQKEMLTDKETGEKYLKLILAK